MYKLIIVDDDIHVINGFQRKIDWDALNIKIIGTALNGHRALEIIKEDKPDIIMTDIKMPIMDGIELIKQVDKMNLNIKVVILSGFSEFEYAKQAIKYNAVDYLLKPTSSEEIISLVKSLVDKLDEERTKEEKAVQEKITLFDHRLIEMLKDNHDSSKLSALILKNKSGITKKHYVVASFIYNKSDDPKLSIKDILNDNYDTKNMLLRWDESRWLLLLFYSNKNGYHRAEELSLRVISFIRDKIHKNNNNTLIISIGLVAKSVSDIRETVYDAFNLLEYAPIRRKGSIIESKNNNNNKNEISGFESVEKKIFGAIDDKDKGSFIQSTKEFYQLIEDQHTFSKNLLINTLTLSFKILMACKKYLEASKKSTSEYLIWQELGNYKSIDDLKDYVISTCIELFNGLKNQTAYAAPIKYTINYIEGNYMLPVYIKDIAENLYISENYLTSLFKKETGISFKKYLTASRMKYAKEFLTNPEYKIHEIATMVGYKNEEYFSRTFKITTGLSPSEYRKTITYNID